jgi:hypothetical protein
LTLRKRSGDQTKQFKLTSNCTGDIHSRKKCILLSLSTYFVAKITENIFWYKSPSAFQGTPSSTPAYTELKQHFSESQPHPRGQAGPKKGYSHLYIIKASAAKQKVPFTNPCAISG